ncbi:MAG: hypothetical protein K2X50_06180 [Gammaproteobacteria bacterium]|nr:hypothetical protein [Gammaproteobacteria bacterium]
MQKPSILSQDTRQQEAPTRGEAANTGLTRFFRTANYQVEDLRFRMAHKTPIPKKAKIELKKPKIEFIAQLLTESNPTEAPILISYANHSLDVLTFEGERICELVGHEAKVTAAKALSDKVIVTGDTNGVLIVWDLTRNEDLEHTSRYLLKRFCEHTNAITAIEAINAQNFVSASLDCSYRYWQIDSDIALQTIESTPKKPILSMTLLSENVVLYCVERVEGKPFISYDIIKCHRLDSRHTIIDQPNYSKSGIFGAITHVKLTPDGRLTLIDQMKNASTVINRVKNISLYAKPPISILSNGWFAFLGNKRNIVVEQFPLVDEPMLSAETQAIVEVKSPAATTL